jgi:Tol biopolymer transport system component
MVGATALVLCMSMPVNGEERGGNRAAPPVTPNATQPTIPPAAHRFASRFTIHNDRGLIGTVFFSAAIDGKDRILALDLASNTIRPLVWGPGSNTAPAVSPDGNRLAFISDREGTPQLYLADAFDGGRPRRLTNDTRGADHPTWAADGARILYTRSSREGSDPTGTPVATTFATITPDGRSESEIVTLPGKNLTPSWGREMEWIVYTTDRFWPGWDICRWDIPKRNEYCILSGSQTFARPAVSHAGDRIAYSVGEGTDLALEVYGTETKRREPLVSIANRHYDAAWSLDDSWILFVSDAEERGVFDLYVVDLKSKTASKVVNAPYSIRGLSWSPKSWSEIEANWYIEQNPTVRPAPAKAPPSYTPPYLAGGSKPDTERKPR